MCQICLERGKFAVTIGQKRFDCFRLLNIEKETTERDVLVEAYVTEAWSDCVVSSLQWEQVGKIRPPTAQLGHRTHVGRGPTVERPNCDRRNDFCALLR